MKNDSNPIIRSEEMVSAGDPIKYANIHSSYWQKYLSGFGRLSK